MGAGSTGGATWAGDVPRPRGAAGGKAATGRGPVAATKETPPAVGGSAAGGGYATPAEEEGSSAAWGSKPSEDPAAATKGAPSVAEGLGLAAAGGHTMGSAPTA